MECVELESTLYKIKTSLSGPKKYSGMQNKWSVNMKINQQELSNLKGKENKKLKKEQILSDLQNNIKDLTCVDSVTEKEKRECGIKDI